VTSEEEAAQLVKRFLRTMEERDLATAEAMMAPGAEIIFPGGKNFSSQREMVEASRGRYQWVKKSFDWMDVYQADDSQVVYVLGTLHGVNRHGVPFSDVRYIDRFVIKNGRIARQEVWNDLAESGVLERAART
jgi:ketosteroid isomerase-like protein